MRPSKLSREYLCVLYTETPPLGKLLADAGNLMASFSQRSRQSSFDDSMEGELPEKLMRAAGLPHDLWWTVGDYGGSFQCIGIGRNKKLRHKATKLAIAVA